MSKNMNANPEVSLTVDEIVEATPVELESVSYNDLRAAMLEIKRQIRNKSSDKKLRRLEEQFCYIVREIELRQTTGAKQANS